MRTSLLGHGGASAAAMVNLSPIDYVVVLLFIGALLALGFSARLRESSAMQFIAAGRALTLPAFVATLVATWYGGILGIGESVSYFGLGTWVLMGVPYYVFALVYALVYARRVRAADQISLPERIEAKFGRAPALVAAGLVFLLGVPAAHVLMLGVLTQAFTGWPLAASVIVATVVGSLFLYKGGLLADVRASMLAFVMMYVGFAVIVGYCLWHFPVAETWGKLAGQPQLTWDGGVGMAAIVVFFILGAWTLIDPGFHQRVASAASPETGRRGVLVCIGFWMLFDVLSIATGMYALTLMKEPPTNGLLLFPAFGDQVLPPGLKAVFLCGMLGTIVCALVGYALVSGATLGRDLVCRLAPAQDATRWTRIGIGVACLVAIGLALTISSVVALWYAWGGCVIGAMLLPVSLAYGLFPRWRVASRAITLSMVLSFGVSVTWLVTAYRAGNTLLNVTLPDSLLGLALPAGVAGTEFGLGTLLPGLAVSALVLGVAAKWPGQRHEPVA